MPYYHDRALVADFDDVVDRGNVGGLSAASAYRALRRWRLSTTRDSTRCS